MTPALLGRLLGAPPAPRGSWEREAALVSTVPLQTAARRGMPAREVAEEIAGRLRGEDGVAGVEIGPNGFLTILLSRPGEIVREITEGGPRAAGAPAMPPVPPRTWPDFPRTWDNPGFAVRYAHVRAAAVRRWARDLGVPYEGFRPEALDGPHDRAVLRLLAELPGRTAGREPAWAAYAERLALAYHDAHERAPALPKGDRPVEDVHTARLRLAGAVQDVLIALLGPELLERM